MTSDPETAADGGTETRADAATVLIVDDESDIADLYTGWLGGTHDVRTAMDGATALDLVDETVDVVFLDRQMPGLSGDDVLEEVRDRGLDCRVAMVTAVDPDYDIVEMPFDDYLTKPVRRDGLLTKVDEMLARTTYDDHVQSYFAMASKKATLESQKSPAELESSDVYATVCDRVEELETDADASVAAVDDYEAVFADFPGGC